MSCLFLYSCNAKVSKKTHDTICITEKHKQCETYYGTEVKRPCGWSTKSKELGTSKEKHKKRIS